MKTSFVQLIELLKNHQVEFSIIGGVALNLQGVARATEDIDLAYARTRRNIEALARAMATIHPKLRGVPEALPFVLDEATLHHGLNFTLDTDLGPVDLLGEVAGLGGFEQVDAASDAITLEGITVLVLSLDGLVAAKRAAGRPKDLLDLGLIAGLRQRS